MIKLQLTLLGLLWFLLICGVGSTTSPADSGPIVIPTLPALDTIPPPRARLSATPITITGSILRVGQTDHAGTEIFITRPGCRDLPPMIAPLITTDKNGQFSIQATPLDSYNPPLITDTHASCLIVMYPNHLTIKHFPIQRTIPTLTMQAGDVNHDEQIDLFDLTLISRQLGHETVEVDLNGDGTVDLLDLTLAAQHYNRP